MADLPKLSGSWAIVVAMISTVAPATAAIRGCQSRKTELALAAGKQQHEIRLSYLDRAIDPAKTPIYRQEVLRFLKETAGADDPMRIWASAELDRAEKEEHSLDDQLQKATVDHERLEQTVLRYKYELLKVRLDREKALAVQGEIDSTNKKIAQNHAVTDYLSLRLDKPVTAQFMAPRAIVKKARGGQCKAGTVVAMAQPSAGDSRPVVRDTVCTDALPNADVEQTDPDGIAGGALQNRWIAVLKDAGKPDLKVMCYCTAQTAVADR